MNASIFYDSVLALIMKGGHLLTPLFITSSLREYLTANYQPLQLYVKQMTKEITTKDNKK